MKIKIIAETSTNPKIIGKLIDEIPKIFPPNLSIDLVDSVKRYEIERRRVLHYGEKIKRTEAEMVDGIQTGFFFAFNVRPVIRKYRCDRSKDPVMIITHESYVDLSREFDFQIPQFVGKIDCGVSYGGSCFGNGVIVGIPNEIHPNNTKVSAHEIAHLFLDPVYGTYGEGNFVNHCENYVKVLRCLMNTPTDTTRKTLRFIGSEFCESCYKKLMECYS